MGKYLHVLFESQEFAHKFKSSPRPVQDHSKASPSPIPFQTLSKFCLRPFQIPSKPSPIQVQSNIGDVSRAVRSVKPKKTATLGLICDVNGTMADTPRKNHPRGHVDPDPDLVWDVFSVSSLEENDDLDGFIMLEKVETSVLFFHSFKVAGSDGNIFQ
ncbi:unnamed protein product [Lepeophtheirus salmonis]|uniref:(salmon louse) hypothetical protein n=1 Tax=Lepeophtheirus salmonis TaxID=72036 RepID=A0A7R8HDF1_LEPSM|nr:unnamed protein product [Lepeophtheirus salmonis]CAF3008084.1 unnamed protein product [Lepeophtheirus salmonis]